jgi:cytochrome c-type biogenesis protein
VFSTLSACVLPLLPLVFGTAVAAHRYGIGALGAWLVLSFVAVGPFVATIGFSIGLDGAIFRGVAAMALGAVGLVLLSPTLQDRLSLVTRCAGSGANTLAAALPGNGLGGPFLLGLVLGAVWSPCVGPTLGAATLLAAQGKDLAAVAFTMAAFGFGAALPLVLVGALSREAMRRWRGRLIQGASGGKKVLGGIAVAASLLILTGLDKQLETILVQASRPA